jgi:hypothetical protein
LELSEFHLQLGFAGASPRGEEVEDQLAAVDDFSLDDFFQTANLSRGQIVIEDHHVGLGVDGPLVKLLELALPECITYGHPHAFLGHSVHDLDPGRLSQCGKLAQGVAQIRRGVGQ